MSEALEAREAASHKARRNWRAEVDQMTDVQRLVHLAAREVDEDERAWRNRIFADVRGEYENTLRQEVKAVGCLDPGRAILQEGVELKAVATRAAESARSIVNTFNYDLARAIRQIGQDAPRANRYVYEHRLSVWQAGRKEVKDQQITDAELGWAVNRAKEAFHQYNAEIAAQAEVVPYPTACPVCAEYVAGNPYSSMDELYRRCELPAHVNCLTPGQIVLTSAGPARIETVKAGDEVVTHLGMGRVSQAFERNHRGLVYRLFVEGRVLQVTGNHPVLTRRGWILAQELSIADEVLALASWYGA